MKFFDISLRNISWRWFAAGTIFMCAFLSLMSGVELTERPTVVSDSWLTKAYYSLGLFVVGGLDLGVPVNGSPFARFALWLAYFGAPMLMASAVIDAVFRVLAPQRWQLRRLSDHYIVNGSGRLTMSYLRMLRQQHPKATVVVVDKEITPEKQQELVSAFNVRIVTGDMTSEFLIRQLRTKRARRIALLAVNDYQCYEAASQILNLYPEMGRQILLHCSNLRFMRAMEDTSISKKCTTFNSYQLASNSLVRERLLKHFHKTAQRDVVVLGGYGRFGQTILEGLSSRAEDELSTVALVDIDADRRVLVADEQQRSKSAQRRIVLQGDVAHPQVWLELSSQVDLTIGEPVVILGTGDASNNLRTALWIKQQYPNALVFARTDYDSRFAQEVASDHDINPISVVETVEGSMPAAWLE